jgi:hypothetical protein
MTSYFGSEAGQVLQEDPLLNPDAPASLSPVEPSEPLENCPLACTFITSDRKGHQHPYEEE